MTYTTRSIFVVLPATALALAGCGAVAAPPSAAPVTTAAVATPVAPTSGPTAGTATWIMPNLVGSGLQDAQNAIQSLTHYGITFTSSHDQSGQGRHQVLDRNWKVCSQNVRAGATITPATKIDFGAVELTESC